MGWSNPSRGQTFARASRCKVQSSFLGSEIWSQIKIDERKTSNTEEINGSPPKKRGCFKNVRSSIVVGLFWHIVVGCDFAEKTRKLQLTFGPLEWWRFVWKIVQLDSSWCLVRRKQTLNRLLFDKRCKKFLGGRISVFLAAGFLVSMQSYFCQGDTGMVRGAGAQFMLSGLKMIKAWWVWDLSHSV